MDKRYAILDMDGTLVNSMGYWRNLWREYLTLKGVTPIPEDMLPRIKALNMKESAELFIREFALSGTPDSVAAEMNAIMGEHYKNHISLKEGMAEHLEELKGNGVRMCVVSATAEHLVKDCISRCGIGDYFEFILSCEETGLGKHRPDIYHMAAMRFGAQPEDIAVYEDALYAARTAKAAGFYLVGVQDERDDEQWRQLCHIADELMLSAPQNLAAEDAK